MDNSSSDAISSRQCCRDMVDVAGSSPNMFLKLCILEDHSCGSFTGGEKLHLLIEQGQESIELLPLD